MDFISYHRQNLEHLQWAAEIWNSACGPDLAFSPAFVEFNTRPTVGVIQEGQFAVINGQPVGFVLASVTLPGPESSAAASGWIDAIAVTPETQGRRIGSTLLNWAEQYLFRNYAERARLGGSLRPFVPGLPVQLDNSDFFERHGYHGRPDSETVWDVARRLDNYPDDPQYSSPGAELRTLQAGEEGELLAFLAREFPGRWHFEFQEFLREGGRLADWLVLRTAEGVQGFVQTTLEDSLRPIERFYPHRLPQPWGQFGPLGVAAHQRGKGYGALVIDGAARHLRSLGINGCVIDWTELVDLYGKFGFEPYREFLILSKALAR